MNFSFNTLARLHLMMAEESKKSDRVELLKKSSESCLVAVKKSKRFRAGLPEAYRLQGIYQWLKNKPSMAQKEWNKSLIGAKELGAKYEQGLTYLEMGKRLEDSTYLEYAESIFTEIGAKLDLAQTQKLLSGK